MSNANERALVYASRATGRLTPAEVKSIQETSIRNNASAGVTGVLLSDCVWFLQVLEGDTGAVETLYEKISHDPRHTDLRVLHDAPVPTRTFSDWSMGLIMLPAPPEGVGGGAALAALIEILLARPSIDDALRTSLREYIEHEHSDAA
jgi:hypothetical protein